MGMTKKNDILYFDKFVKFPNLVHGFSTRAFGDMRPIRPDMVNSLKNFAKALGVDSEKIVRMHQVHSSIVRWIREKETSDDLGKIDGVLSSGSNVFLSVVTADCIPVMLYDTQKKFVAIVHCGWRGLYGEIVKKAIEEMIKNGSSSDNIIVGLGPSIRVCCYEVGEDHAEKFADKFPDFNCVIKRDGKIFLDLPMLLDYQLRSLGILATNIEDSQICTYDSPDLYSYRREGEGFGEFVGIIGRV